MTYNAANSPPPVHVEPFDRNDVFTVDGQACGTVLASFELDGKKMDHAAIENTVVCMTPRNESTEHLEPVYGDAYFLYPNASSGQTTEDGTGIVLLHEGSVLQHGFGEENQELVAGQTSAEDKLRSSLLIEGLSQRADEAIRGPGFLKAEQQAAEKKLRRLPIIKALGKNTLGAAAYITGDVVAANYNIIPTAIAWVGGVVGVLALAWSGKISATIETRQTRAKYDAYRLWPAQKRANRRQEQYLKDTDAPILVRQAPENTRQYFGT